MWVGDPWLCSFFHLALGLVLGSVLFRADFCMAGILRDLFLFRDYTLLRHLSLAVILVALFFQLIRGAGLVLPDPPPTFGSGSLLGVLGGMLFGIGMVLAGGCVLSTLYKMAGGNLAHAIAFIGMIAGSLIYAEFYPLLKGAEQWASVSDWTTLMQRWPLGGQIAIWLAIAAGAVLFAVWQRQGKWHVCAAARGYMQPWVVALVLALLNLAAYASFGWPIGISTAYAKLGALAEGLLAPSHAAGLEYFNRPSLAAVVGGSVISGGSGPQIDLYIFTEVSLMVGVLAGAFFNAVLLGEFRIYGLPPLRQGVVAFIGGILIALGARMAGGCNVKHLLGGLPLLAIQSMLFVAGLLAGTWVGTRLLLKTMFR